MEASPTKTHSKDPLLDSLPMPLQEYLEADGKIVLQDGLIVLPAIPKQFEKKVFLKIES